MTTKLARDKVPVQTCRTNQGSAVAPPRVNDTFAHPRGGSHPRARWKQSIVVRPTSLQPPAHFNRRHKLGEHLANWVTKLICLTLPRYPSLVLSSTAHPTDVAIGQPKPSKQPRVVIGATHLHPGFHPRQTDAHPISIHCPQYLPSAMAQLLHRNLPNPPPCVLAR